MTRKEIRDAIAYANYHGMRGELLRPYEINIDSLDEIDINLLNEIVDDSMVRFNYNGQNVPVLKTKEYLGYGVKVNKVDKNSVPYQIYQANKAIQNNNLLAPRVITVRDVNVLTKDILDSIIDPDMIKFNINGFVYSVADIKYYLGLSDRRGR